MKRIAVLTGGGDAPGLNAAMKAVVYKANDYDIKVIGIIDGWEGLLDGFCDEYFELGYTVVRAWDRHGGTNIGSSRTNPFKCKDEESKEVRDRSNEILRNIEKLELDAVIALGGEDTLGVGYKLWKKGAPIIGIPKTIDKDIPGTDYTLGFDTALRSCSEIIEKSRTPAGSHHWIQVLEIMGRHTGHLALWSGIAGGAYIILIPEWKFSWEKLFTLIEKRMERGTRDRRYPRYAVLTVSEGSSAEEEDVVTIEKSRDDFGHVKLGGIGQYISEKIRKDTKWDSRAVVLGHTQRGGPPSPVDRIMGFLYGSAAVEAAVAKMFGMMVSAKGVAPACKISLVRLDVAAGGLNLVDVDKYYDTNKYNAKREILESPE